LNISYDRTQKKKKNIKWAAIGGIVLVVVILAIAIPLGLRKHKKKDDPDSPNPPIDSDDPFKFQEFNHFSLE